MYRLSVSRAFIARHYLTVPDPGLEGELHSHRFEVSVRFAGPELGEHGYLVDIDAVDDALGELTARYRDAVLNDLPEFEGLNPSVEHFARLFGDRLLERVSPAAATGLTVRMREDDRAWASHGRDL